jgi:hypothetical protein
MTSARSGCRRAQPVQAAASSGRSKAVPGNFPANTSNAAGHGQGVLLAVEQLAEALSLGVAAGRESGACIRLAETVSLGICAIRACTGLDLRDGLSVSARERLLITGVNGPANGPVAIEPDLPIFRFQAGHMPSCYGSCECPVLSPVAAACRWSLLLLSPLLSTRRRPSNSKPTRTLQGMTRVWSGHP